MLRLSPSGSALEAKLCRRVMESDVVQAGTGADAAPGALQVRQKSFYVEISRARDRAEPVTGDAAELRAQLQVVTGERIAALEGIGEMERQAPEKATAASRGVEKAPDAGKVSDAVKERTSDRSPVRGPQKMPKPSRTGLDLGL